jgi:hypothetical protein
LCDCEECSKLTERKTIFFEAINGKPCELDCKETIVSHEKRALESTVKKLLQIYESLIVKRFCSVDFDKEINSSLHAVLREPRDGELPEAVVKSHVSKIYEKLKLLAEQKSSRESVTEKVKFELTQTYHQYPDFLKKFSEPIEGKLFV